MRDKKLRKRVIKLEENGVGGGSRLYRHDISFHYYPLDIRLTLLTRDSESYNPDTFIAYVQRLQGLVDIPCSGTGKYLNDFAFPFMIFKGVPNTTLNVYYLQYGSSGWKLPTISFSAKNISSSFVDVTSET